MPTPATARARIVESERPQLFFGCAEAVEGAAWRYREGRGTRMTDKGRPCDLEATDRV